MITNVGTNKGDHRNIIVFIFCVIWVVSVISNLINNVIVVQSNNIIIFIFDNVILFLTLSFILTVVCVIRKGTATHQHICPDMLKKIFSIQGIDALRCRQPERDARETYANTL